LGINGGCLKGGILKFELRSVRVYILMYQGDDAGDTDTSKCFVHFNQDFT